MPRWAGRLSGGLVALALVALGAKIGTNDNTSGLALIVPTHLEPGSACGTGTISGAGSTFVQTILQEWISGYQRACPRATINYQGAGSGAGIQQFISQTVGFAASDVVMTPVELRAAQARGGPVLEIPWAAGGIAVEYHLEGVRYLQLRPRTLAGIFAGTITQWDQPAIRADNPGITLPAEGIQVVHRSDGSGTTAAFTRYLAAAAPSLWKAGSGKEVAWPTGQGAKGSDQVTAAVEQSEGAIGYSEVAYAKATGLGIAQIENPAGRFVGPTADAVSIALESATASAKGAASGGGGTGTAQVTGAGTARLNPLPADPVAYPISTLTWVMLYTRQPDARQGALLSSFLAYALGPGQVATRSLYYAPLPASLLAADRATLARIAP